ncbi:MAG: DMT family transporter [Bacteroidota bacterium]
MKSNTGNHYFFIGIVISVAGALLFSTKAVLVKLAYLDSSPQPITLLAVRMLFSLPFFAISSMVAEWRSTEKVPMTTRLAIAATGILGYHISSLLDFAGLQYISAGLERLVLFTYPTLVLIMGAVFFHDRITGRQWLAVVISYLGILLAFTGEYHASVLTGKLILVSLLVFGCAFTYGSYILFSSKLIGKTGAARFNSQAMLAACAGVLLHFFIAGEESLSVLPASTWWYGFLMAVFSTVIPSYLIAESIKRIGGENTAIIASIGPVSTIVMAGWVLEETVSVLQLAGTTAILAGVWMVAKEGKKGG